MSNSLRPGGLYPLSLEFSRQEYRNGLPFPSPGDLPDRGIKPRSPALRADALTSEPPGQPPTMQIKVPKLWNCDIHLKITLIKISRNHWCTKTNVMLIRLGNTEIQLRLKTKVYPKKSFPEK